MADVPLDRIKTLPQPGARGMNARWKRRLTLATLALVMFMVGFVIVTPAQAQTTMAKAIATMHAMGMREPGDIGMIAIGLFGVLLGRQSGLFMSRHSQL